MRKGASSHTDIYLTNSIEKICDQNEQKEENMQRM